MTSARLGGCARSIAATRATIVPKAQLLPSDATNGVSRRTHYLIGGRTVGLSVFRSESGRGRDQLQELRLIGLQSVAEKVAQGLQILDVVADRLHHLGEQQNQQAF